MTTKLQKWGNSLGIRIQKETAKRAGFKEGRNVSVKNIGNFVVISNVKEETLENLVSKITPENRYEETYWGPPVGNEVW